MVLRTIRGIKNENDSLLEEISERVLELKDYASLENPPEDLNQVIERAESLAKDIENYPSQIDHIQMEDYIWLNEAALSWQSIFSKVFRIQKRINVTQPKKFDPPPLEENIRYPLLFETQLKEWISIKASVLSKERRLAFFNEAVQKIGYFDAVLGKILSSKDEELNDYYTANTFLACEILDRNIDFACQISSECYGWLESVWIKEVKKLKAFYLSKDRGDGYGDTFEDYTRACQQIYQFLLGVANPNIKVPSEYFGEIKDYIEHNYLTEGKIDSLNHEKGGKLIAEKARRISEALFPFKGFDNNSDDFNNRNWRWAETFVKGFYENIIGAVEDGDIEKASKVLSTLQLKEVLPEGYNILPENHDLITNCFEASIVVYFLDPLILKQCQEKGTPATVII
ncbi:hypothetical protein PGN35_007350 [Nodosilinea sp. PGN35]|uniref:hypothetical protein n=1 Tax=Nodosilinea sp. PGN35 TaxID=3020489 RepID=UPI0023B29562|nr:hypothetical protein [Nodosilinea sp. TSF1-S3]MDF0367088.1 hypothetical protein [Nodosilinea sp. TSF1-S3]